MIRTLAALALLTVSTHSIAAAASKPQPALSSTASWWEKVIVTIAGDGQPNSCQYQTSLMPGGSKDCDVVGDAKSLGASEPAAAKDQFTRLTFERRFSPGSMPQDAALETGDTLLGRQVMSLAIDAAGKVKGCRIVASSGDMTPSYGCSDAAGEHFAASTASGEAHEGFMTILVYGHEEHVV